jgi:peroxiredoxin
MKSIILSALGLVMLIASGNAKAVTVGEMFPKVSIAGIDKGEVNSEKLLGKVSVINFWATWCEACKVELKEMQQAFAGLISNKDFQFIFVTLDKDPSQAVDWVNANLPNAADALKFLFKDPDFIAAERLAVDAFPMTFIIGKDGKIKHVQRGFREGEGSTGKIAQLSEELLKN